MSEAYHNTPDGTSAGYEGKVTGLALLQYLVLDELRNNAACGACAGHEGKVTGLALLPDWTLASVSHDRTIRLWDLHTFKLINTVRDAHATPLQGIDYSPDTNEVVTFAMDNLAYVWDAVRLQARYALLGHTAEVTQVCC